jgi:hypothetical protein
VALTEVGRFGKAVQYVQRAAKALYEAAKEVFEKVKVAVQRLVELFVETVTRVLAWVDEHKAYLFLMAAVAAGVIALNIALDMWGLVELEKLAHFAMGMTPFIPAGVKEYPREEVFNILKNAPDPYEKFKEMARDANAGKTKLPQPWESLRVLIIPKPSGESRLMKGKTYSELDEGKKKSLFYAFLALEEAFGVYRSALREVVEGLREAVKKREVGEEPFGRVMYMADFGLLTQLAEKEDKAFEKVLEILREKLNEYAVKYNLRDHLNVEEGKARGLAEAETAKLSRYSGVSFGVKALAALIAYREYALGRGGTFGTAARYWLEVGGSARLLYYAPITAYGKAIEARAEKPSAVEEMTKAKAERPAAVDEMVAEALRRLFLKPGADHYSRFIKELKEGVKLALMLENEAESSYMFKLYKLEESGKLKELDIKLWISKVGEGEEAGITYFLVFKVKRWREFFKQELEAGMKAAEVVGERLPVEDRFSYMGGWVRSDVAITRNKKGKRMLQMSTSHLWQMAETHALFDWSRVVGLCMTLTLEEPKLQVIVEAPLKNLDEAIRRSAEGGWLRMLSDKEGLEDLVYVKSWDELKQWVAKNWDVVVNAAVSRLREVLKEEELRRLLAPKGRDAPEGRKGGQEALRDKQKDGENVWEELRHRLNALRDMLNDDKIAREAIAPALLLIQAERLDVNETTLKYFAAVASGAIDGDGYVSAARKEVGLTSGKLEVALLEAAALAAYGIKSEVKRVWSAFNVVASGIGAARLAGLYFLYGPPLLEGDDRLKSHKLAEAVKLGAEGLDIRWEGLRRTPSGLVAADLTTSVSGVAVRYNVYLRGDAIGLQVQSTDRSRAELAARLLRHAGVGAEVRRVGDEWQVVVYTGKLAAGHERLRRALAEIVEAVRSNGWVDEKRAERWLKKLEKGRVSKERWPMYYVGLNDGAPVVIFSSTKSDRIEQEAQKFREMGLKEGKHFTVKMPKGGKEGYVFISSVGLRCAARLSVHGSGRQRELAEEFISYILKRAEEKSKAKKEDEDVYEKVKEVVEKGKSWGSLTLKGFAATVDGGYEVKVIDGGAEIEESWSGKKLLRLRITAEVNGVRDDYTITYIRDDRNKAMGYAVMRADAPGGREADKERLSALVEALTGKKPWKDSKKIRCCREHLGGFARFAEFADAIEEWLEETGGW